MKVKLLAAAGIALFVAAVYFIKGKVKSKVQKQLPDKENERHHLTNVFSKAKNMAVGN